MIISEREALLREFMDISDRDTLKAMTEAHDSQDKMIMALTSKLYEKILEKYNTIDFSSVSRSRGDITKIEKYDSLIECVSIITRLVKEYREDTYPVDIVNTAIVNIKTRTTMFKKAFAINSPLGVMVYNTMCMGIIDCVDFLINTCIEYIKSPHQDSFQMALNTVAYHNTKNNLMFESVQAFNEGCRTGEFDKAMEGAMKVTKIKHESATIVKHDSPFLDPEKDESDDSEVVVHDDNENLNEAIDYTKLDPLVSNASFFSRIGFFIIRCIVPICRFLSYKWFAWKQKKSDYYAAQATLVEMNAMQLQYNNTIDINKKKSIFEKQMKLADKYRDKSNKYSVDFNIAKKSVEKMIRDEEKQYTIKDLNMSDNNGYFSTNSVLF